MLKQQIAQSDHMEAWETEEALTDTEPSEEEADSEPLVLEPHYYLVQPGSALDQGCQSPHEHHQFLSTSMVDGSQIRRL